MKKYLKTILTTIVVISFLITSFTAYAYSNDMIRDNNEKDNQQDILIDRDSDWYYKPSSYAELVEWYQDLEVNFSNYIEVFKANELYNTGQATGGYDLYYVRITNESLGFHKPEVLFLGSPHGDETVGTIGMYWFLDWFTRKAFTDEPCEEYDKEWLNWLVDNREIYFEVSHNPYGFDHGPQRYDGNGWDLNREADYDGPGDNTGGLWASENGKTLYRFINNHTIRVGCDMHGGTRMLIYPWASTYHTLEATSPISGNSYEGSPPDFYFYDAAGLRLGAYMGDGGGDGPLDESNVGTIDEYIWYEVKGGICPWAYAADVVSNPLEDIYVDDETFGNYPGTGILWYSPEMSETKNPSESMFGNDTTDGWGWEIRRYILHQTDIAQPYIRWQPATIENHQVVRTDKPITLQWQINGSLVVDHTSIQYGSNPDPITTYDYTTNDNDQYAGQYIGGTGWDNAYDGTTDSITYEEILQIDTPGEYYFVAKAQVDQIYGNVFSSETYGDDPYLRLVKERTNASYYESLTGTDGLEEIIGQTWWYSSVIHVTVIYPPDHEIVVDELTVNEYVAHNETINVSALIKNEGINDETDVVINFLINGTIEDSTIISSLLSTESELVTFAWNPPIGVYNVSIHAVPVIGETETSNNQLFKTVHVIPSSSIWYNPDEYNVITNEGLLETQYLTIGNYYYADESLDFNIACTNNGGYNWLSSNITTGIIMPGQELIISINIDATGLELGNYQEFITIESNDVDESMVIIPVNLTIVLGDDVGATSVNYPTGSIPAGSYMINATVQNFGSNDQFDVLVNCSVFEGGIGGTIIDEDFASNPSDWTITNIEGTAWSWDSGDERMENSYSGSPSGYLDSPVLDCSGKSGISLSFWHYWKADYSSGNQDGYVRGSIDGGLSFPFLIDEFHHNDPADETAVKSYDISSWANNQPQVMIRFDITNDNDWYWYVDDFNVSAEITGPLVYASESLVDIAAYDSLFVEFTPAWVVSGGMYGIQITTLLVGDEYPGNDIAADVVSIDGPGLSFDPTSYDAGNIPVNSSDGTTFAIWNGGVGLLTYDLSESCDWVEVSPLSGDSTGEHDVITVDIDTTDLPEGPYHCDISISSNAGAGVFSVDMNVISDTTPLEDVNQSAFDRGFPVRHTWDGDWGAAQNFTPSMGVISQVGIYLRKFGTPEFDLTVELRENGPEGTLLDSVVFPAAEVPSSWTWLMVDFSDTLVESGTDYFIVLPPAPSGVSTSFGYEWGYAFGDHYQPGSFWFTRDGGGLWRDLPTMYEFTFKTYGTG